MRLSSRCLHLTISSEHVSFRSWYVPTILLVCPEAEVCTVTQGMYPTVIILLVALDKSHFSTASVSLTGEGSSISSIRFRYTGGSKAKESVCLDRGYGKADSALLSSMVG